MVITNGLIIKTNVGSLKHEAVAFFTNTIVTKPGE